MCYSKPTTFVKKKYVYKQFAHVVIDTNEHLETPIARMKIGLATDVWHKAPGWLWGIFNRVRRHAGYERYMVGRFCVYLTKADARATVHEVWKLEVREPVATTSRGVVGLVREFRLVKQVVYK